MSSPARFFMDVSYTRTQHVNVGIIRTVRRLEGELHRLCEREGGKFEAAAFHSTGFRQMADGRLPPPARSSSEYTDKAGARLYGLIAGPLFRRLVLIALLLPWPVLRRIWAATSSRVFDFLSRGQSRIAFQQGDVLLLGDASWNYPVWEAARRARAQGAKVVLVVYDLMPLRHPEFCFPLVPPTFRLWLERMLPLADCVICISGATEQDLRNHARERGMALPPTGHFRLGSDAVPDTVSGGNVREAVRRFLEAGPPCFAAVGSFEPKKNYGFLLDVFERLWRRGESVRLLIIGRESAECRNLIRRICEHAEQGGKLLALFDAADAEVALTYANCRALIFTSMAEGFGLPLVEARTRGSLVIASDLPAFAELADAGVSLYPQGSPAALEALVMQHAVSDRRAEIPAMGAFTWEDSARQFLRVFQGLCAAERSA